jgi:hypothetical protein
MPPSFLSLQDIRKQKKPAEIIKSNFFMLIFILVN